MEENGRLSAAREDIHAGEAAAIIRANWWKIAGLSVVAGVVTLFVTLRIPDSYQTSATITPSIEEAKQNPALGAIASLGFQTAGPSKVEDLETLFKSKDLAVRIFSKYDLWQFVLGDRYDAMTGTVKPSWGQRLVGRTAAKKPEEWDAIRAAQKGLTVVVNRRTGSISLSFECLSPKGSAEIVKYYLDEGKNRLQEEALDRANQNKEFIEGQIARTVDVLTRERLYSLLGQEMEREMMAKNRGQFGFRVIDSPRVPDRKLGPQRLTTTATATIVFFFASCLLFIVRGRRS